MARTRLELLAEGSVVTMVLLGFLLGAFPIAAKSEGIRREISDLSSDFSADRS